MTPVLASIYGSLAVIDKPSGSVVKKGETIAQIECMKSFWELIAPADGVIHWRLTLGEVVGQDEIVAQIEEA